MLFHSARTLSSRRGREWKTLHEGMVRICSWYNSAEKKGRLLTEWHEVSIAKAMGDQPHSIQIEHFKKFAARLVALQHELSNAFHTVAT